MIKQLKPARGLLTIVFILLIGSNCHHNTEPDKVWNLRTKIVKLALSLEGTPYRYGGTEIDGFDCSGLVYYVYHSYGYKLPRTAKKQGKIRSRIPFSEVRPGDIMVFRIKRQWHSGVYIGKNMFVHAAGKARVVKKSTVTDFWKKHLRFVVTIIK